MREREILSGEREREISSGEKSLKAPKRMLFFFDRRLNFQEVYQNFYELKTQLCLQVSNVDL